MLEIDVPGYQTLRFEHLVLDYNGTLAYDGEFLDGVASTLNDLSGVVCLHVLTGDTFGRARVALAKAPCKLVILPATDQDTGKLHYVERLGAESCVAVGNGRNDRRMLRVAGLAIAVLRSEGLATEAMMAADIIVPDIHAAFGLLLRPLRLVATLVLMRTLL